MQLQQAAGLGHHDTFLLWMSGRQQAAAEAESQAMKRSQFPHSKISRRSLPATVTTACIAGFSLLAYWYHSYTGGLAMSALLIKDIPPELHSRLKREAARNHRSMNRHVLAILEQALTAEPARELPAPAKGKFLLTDRWLNKAKRAGRK